MTSRTPPIRVRPSEDQFVADLANVFRRHRIGCGSPRDLQHLASDLDQNYRMRSDLFMLCTAISHMGENDLAPEQLFTLVARAMGGPTVDGSGSNSVQAPPQARTAFLSQYQAWAGRSPEFDSGITEEQPEEAPTEWRSPETPFLRAARLSTLAQQPPGDTPAMIPPRRARPDISSRTPIGELTADEIRSFLAGLESASHRIAAVHPVPDTLATVRDPAAYPITPPPLPPPLAVAPIALDQSPGEASTALTPDDSIQPVDATLAIPQDPDSSLAVVLPPSEQPPQASASAVTPQPIATEVILPERPAIATAPEASLSGQPKSPRTAGVSPSPLPAYSGPDMFRVVSEGPSKGSRFLVPALVSVVLLGAGGTLGYRFLDHAALRSRVPALPGASSSPSDSDQQPGSTETPQTSTRSGSITGVQARHPLVSGSAATPRVTGAAGAKSAASGTVSPLSERPGTVMISVPSPGMLRYAISSPDPQYPESERPAATSEVTVQTTISKDGRVTSARAISGPQQLRPAAEAALRQWRFRPYLVDGTPTDVATTVTFTFNPR